MRTDGTPVGTGAAAPTRESRLTAAFVHLTDTMVTAFDLEQFLQALMSTCVELFHTDAAGLLLTDQDGRLHIAACSTDAARTLEVVQLAADAGPCLESFAMSAPVAVPDITETHDRWPAFVEAAAEHGLRSSYATPMRHHTRTIGTINLFSGHPSALDDADLAALQALSDVATVGILQERRLQDSLTLTRQLQEALTSRILIEQAKGIIAHAAGITIDEAFQRLRQRSRRTNIKMTDIAAAVIRQSDER